MPLQNFKSRNTYDTLLKNLGFSSANHYLEDLIGNLKPSLKKPSKPILQLQQPNEKSTGKTKIPPNTTSPIVKKEPIGKSNSPQQGFNIKISGPTYDQAN